MRVGGEGEGEVGGLWSGGHASMVGEGCSERRSGCVMCLGENKDVSGGGVGVEGSKGCVGGVHGLEVECGLRGGGGCGEFVGEVGGERSSRVIMGALGEGGCGGGA